MNSEIESPKMKIQDEKEERKKSFLKAKTYKTFNDDQENSLMMKNSTMSRMSKI